MGRKALFTEEQVFETADRLVTDGKEVTASSLLAALGGGSLTTIYKHMAAWLASRPAGSTMPTPIEIPDAVQGAFNAAWKVATSEAGREVSAVRERAAEEVRAAQKQFHEALQNIERLEAEGEADAGRIEALTGKAAELETTLQKAENEKAALKATTEQLRQQVKSQEAELERVHKDSEGERQRHQKEVGQVTAAASAAQEQANNQLAGLREQLGELQRSFEKIQRERDEAQLTAREATSRADNAEKRIQKAEEQVDLARKEKDSAVKEAAELRGRADTLNAQNKELLSRLGDGSKPPEKKKV